MHVRETVGPTAALRYSRCEGLLKTVCTEPSITYRIRASHSIKCPVKSENEPTRFALAATWAAASRSAPSPHVFQDEGDLSDHAEMYPLCTGRFLTARTNLR